MERWSDKGSHQEATALSLCVSSGSRPSTLLIGKQPDPYVRISARAWWTEDACVAANIRPTESSPYPRRGVVRGDMTMCSDQVISFQQSTDSQAKRYKYQLVYV